ncbi:type III secretion system gatekeeper subunit SctW [Telmatospirillum sp. J64-1]|uniref:type III secretion system gatekeeper subunit SctW n=1 Tax=Telmatospirillum sp. J64-1 TaxID=2502183 RepID=UPI00115C7637|nr:type III secretion system gatekeeper subunit SctW [Telmatospirillum sp. J64-1]
MKIEGAQFGQLQGGANDAADAAPQQGAWRGETVTVERSIASQLADAAEELTFSQSEKEEEKEVSERKMQAPRLAELMQVQQIMDYLSLLGGEHNQEKLKELVARLSNGARPGEAVGEAFAEPAKQFLALNYALRHFEEQGGPEELLASLRQQLEELNEDHYQAIWADLNTAGAAQAFGGGNEAQADSFRECYRETVLGREALGETFNSVLQRFGKDDLSRSIGMLIRAAGDDLSARGPSTAPAELQSILEDLYQLKVLVTVLEGCNEVADRLARDFGKSGLRAEDMMSKLVGLTGERWITSDRVSAVARDMGVYGVEERIAFLKGTRDILRDMPLKIFAEPETRDKLLGAAQEALDLAIEEEE